jgi:hypothetical protein
MRPVRGTICVAAWQQLHSTDTLRVACLASFATEIPARIHLTGDMHWHVCSKNKVSNCSRRYCRQPESKRSAWRNRMNGRAFAPDLGSKPEMANHPAQEHSSLTDACHQPTAPNGEPSIPQDWPGMTLGFWLRRNGLSGGLLQRRDCASHDSVRMYA